MLAKENRLTRKADFLDIRQNGKFVGGRLVSISYIKRKGDASRFGIIVSKKISMSSVIRNRQKRVLREIIRKKIGDMKSIYDVVVIVKRLILKATNSEIEKEIDNVLQNL